MRFINLFKRIVNKSIDVFDLFIYNLSSKRKENEQLLVYNIINNGLPKSIGFDFEEIKINTLNYIDSLKVDDKIYKYKFCQSQNIDNLYSSVFVLLTLDLYDETAKLSEKDKQDWVDYFNSFQSSGDGLWYDKNLKNEFYNNGDWWGARHLASLLIYAYNILNAKPRYKLTFIEEYYNLEFLKNFLDQEYWNKFFPHENDIDNKIMNLGVILQYKRDFFNDERAKNSLTFLKKYLESKVNKHTSLWGEYETNIPYQLSRGIQFAYHLYRLYIYDKLEIKNKEELVKLSLKTQNNFGGYSEFLNSSACEDMDSLDLIINYGSIDNIEVENSIKKSFVWILSNQNQDGGFVFRRYESFFFGHDILTSQKNESNIFATWFRTLSIAKISKKLILKNNYKYLDFPGY